jgi:threonine dehydratase
VPLKGKDISRARERISPHIIRTPFAFSQVLSKVTGAKVYLKFENLQFTAAFKERGALNRLLTLNPEQARRGVVAASAGNHAQGVSYHANRLKIPATIVMPRFTPTVKVENTRAHGAEVILEGETFDEANSHTQRLARERKLTLIHPYDDFRVMAGQGTLALEMLETVPELDVMVVPIGGGGLAAGVAVGAKAVKPEISIVGVQSRRFPAVKQQLEGKPVETERYTVADGIAVRKPGRKTLPILRDHLEEILLVGEDELEDAILKLLQIEKTVVEGAGAAGLAALLQQKRRFRGKRVGLILCGGNIDLMILSSIIQRGLARLGRLVCLRVETRDVPGELARVSELIGTSGGNIVEVHHQRAFSSRPLQTAMVDFIVQTRGRPHLGELLSTLEKAGYQAWIAEEDNRPRNG